MSGTDEKVHRLLDTDIFKSVPKEQLVEIAKVVQDNVVSPKTNIFRKGDPGDSYYIIHSGKVRVFLKSEDGVETELNLLGPGESFGEMALLTDEPRSADIEAIEETHLFVLTKEEFDGVLKNHPGIFRNFIKHMSELLKQDDRRIQEETEFQYHAPKISLLDFVFIGVMILIFATIFNFTEKGINIIPEYYDPEEIPRVGLSMAKEKYDEGETLFIDARPNNFFEKGHIKGAINMPLSLFSIMYLLIGELDEEEDIIVVDKEKNIIVYGRSMSALYDEKVARKFTDLGHKNVTILEAGSPYIPLTWGALSGWRKNRYPIEEESDND
jgi:rhodanese-related sulfurtransferase